MAIVAYGLNFRTASIDLRERIAFPEETLVSALQDLRTRLPAVSEAAILSTCNRTELYCTLEDNDYTPLTNWLACHRNIPAHTIADVSYAHWDRDAARHLMRVASGLDSQVLGEPQILGQVKDACELARSAGTLGRELQLLSQLTLNVAKRIRTDTDIGRNPVSVAYAAVSLAQQIFPNLVNSRALLLGAGETIELVANHLQGAGVRKMTIANRTLANAEQLAKRFGGDAIQLTDVPGCLHQFDIVIASTGSPLPVLGKGAVEAALRSRKHWPMFMVDLAVPRDIEPETAELRDVFLYTIDDLGEIIEANVHDRRRAAEMAEAIVLEGADQYFREKRIRDAQRLLLSFRSQAEEIQSRELERALTQLRSGGDPEQVIGQLARTLTNKLIHRPTVAIRDASAGERGELLDYVRALYDIDPDKQEPTS